MRQLDDVLQSPATYLILGDTGTGKTATMADIIDWAHSQDYQIIMVDKLEGFPKWVENSDGEHFTFKKPNRLICVDDAHNRYYAGEEFKNEFKALDLINRARRKGGNTTVVYTTQNSTVLTRKLISMCTAIIFKRPSVLQIKFERPEMQDLFDEAREQLKTVNFDVKIAYFVGPVSSELVEVNMPSWFTKEVSATPIHSKEDKNSGMLKSVIGLISAVGKAA